MLPHNVYEGDVGPTSTQHKELRKLVQLEGETYEFMARDTNEMQRRAERKRTEEDVRAICMEAHDQAEWTRETLVEMRQAVGASQRENVDRAGNHARSIHDIEDHVEFFRAINEHEDATHENDHNREIETERGFSKHLSVFEKGGKNGRQPKYWSENSDDEDRETNKNRLVCQMTGQQWEQFPFLLIMDPGGACASAMSITLRSPVSLANTPQSEVGEFFGPANGQKIHNQGERGASMMAKEGAMRDMRLIVCDVSKALGSVSQMCRVGHKVAFNPPRDPAGSYIQHMEPAEKLRLEEHNGFYVLNTSVAPSHRQSTNRTKQKSDLGFRW